MALPISQSPMNPDFIFHDVGIPNPYHALVYIPSPLAGATAVTPSGTSGFVVGDLSSDSQTYRIRGSIQAGRFGLPALEVSITIFASTTHPELSVVVAFEPGVTETTPKGQRYQLDECKAEWLGKSGGSGMHYQHDPIVVGLTSLPTRKGMLRITAKLFGCITYPNTLAVAKVLNSVPPTNLGRQLLSRLISANDLDIRMYFVVGESEKAKYINTVLKPFETALSLRLIPFHQYSPARTMLTFEMPATSAFRHRMYCNRTANRQFSAPQYELPDTQPRRAIQTIAVIQTVGLIREQQAYDTLCSSFCTMPQSMRLVTSGSPLLSTSARMFGSQTNNPNVALPLDSYQYVGYVGNSSVAVAKKIMAPRAGSIFRIRWSPANQQSATEEAVGIVLNVPASCLVSKNAAFVLALGWLTLSAKGRAYSSLTVAAPEAVTLSYVQNHSYAQIQRSALLTLSAKSSKASVVALQTNSAWRMLDTVPNVRDLRPQDRMAWDTAYIDIAYGNFIKQPSQQEVKLLSEVPQHLNGHLQLVQTAPSAPGFRSVLLLTLLFSIVGRQVIIVSDLAEQKASICHELRQIFIHAAQAENCGPLWAQKQLLHYTTTGIDTAVTVNASASLRTQLDITFKILLDDLPEHQWATDETNALWSGNSAKSVPLTMSLGDAIQRHLSPPHQITARQRYFLDRKAMLDAPGQMTDAAVSQLLGRRNAMIQEILKKIDVLVCDYATAASEIVQHAVSEPILILIGTENVTFPHAAAVLLSHLNHHGAFVCGCPYSRQQVELASTRFQNEALASYSRSAWWVLRMAGTSCYEFA